MSSIILDTETHDMNGYPIEIAHVPVHFENGELVVNKDACFDEYFSCPQPIRYGAMAVHHILESDIAGKPSYETFRLPEGIQYIIGHNVDYDIQAIKLAVKSVNVKAICTLALDRAAMLRFIGPDENSLCAAALHRSLRSRAAAGCSAIRRRSPAWPPTI